MALNLSKDLFPRTGLEQDTGRLSERWGQDGSLQRGVSVAYNNTDGTLLTVTAGKVFYLRTLLANAATQTCQLKDGGTGGTLIISFKTVVDVQSAFVFDPPAAFLTSVFHEFVNAGGIGEGTCTYTIIGWEEDAP